MIKRNLYLERIRPFMGKDIIKVLTGIRRCGKSIMLQLIQEDMLEAGISKEQMFFINFETKSVDYVTNADAAYQTIRKFSEEHKGKIYLFLDEIQELEHWETMLNSCIIDFDADIYITGSNAKMLSGELATYLGGRYVEFTIYPFSFSEIMQTEIMQGKTPAEAFRIYLVQGGMPFLYQFPFSGTDSRQYLEDIYSSIILKDIAQRNHIRDMELLKRILLYFITNIGNTFSASNIAKYLKSERRGLSPETLYNYIDYCQTACLLHLVQREDVIGKKTLRFQEKIYITDHGFRESVYGHNLRDINQILENIVYIELKRRNYKITVGKAAETEVDFAAIRGNEKIYIQVCYLLASAETAEREFGSLQRIPDNYSKYVVSMDEIDFSHDGIKHVNIRDFLTMDKYSL